MSEGFVELDTFGTVQIELDDFFDPILTEDGGNTDEISPGIVLAVAINAARNYSLFTVFLSFNIASAIFTAPAAGA